jgi:RNA polymerase sigma factor (sigma-70 family)
VDIGDGDLVRLARTGDAAAFRLLVERHRTAALARAVRLGARPGDADDIVQEAFLQAFTALDRLRDPDRFGAWLAGIVLNVHRAATRRPPPLLLADWPEDLHPASAEGLPSAEDLDRAEALGAAVAGLPPGQRRAVELYYYAGLPVAEIAASPGAAKASLHKARGRLREHITTHRPDLIPVLSRRTPMTTVRIACAQPHRGTTPDGSTAIAHILVVLADEPGHRAMGLWLRTRQGLALWRVMEQAARDTGPSAARRPPAGGLAAGGVAGGVAGDLAGGLAAGGLAGDLAGDRPYTEFTPEGLAIRLLGAADGTVTGVDIDELGPGVLAAQVGVAGPAGTRQVTADPGSALALAAALEVPVRVAGALMDRLAVPVSGDDLLGPFTRRTPTRPAGPDSGPAGWRSGPAGPGSGPAGWRSGPAGPGSGPAGPGSGPAGPGSGPAGPGSGPAGWRSGPQNLDFTDGLTGWITSGSSRAEVTGSHWDDYTVTAAAGTATLAAVVPHPYGDVFLGQEFRADDYHGTTVTLRAEIHANDVAGHGELSLYVVDKPEDPPAPGPVPQAIHRARQEHHRTITGSQDWTSYALTAPVPASAEAVEFDLTLTGPGQIELRNVTLTRAS